MAIIVKLGILNESFSHVQAQLSGYTARLFSSQDVCNRAAYAVQSVLLLLGPTLLMFSVNLTQTAFAEAVDGASFCWLRINYQGIAYLIVNTILMIIQVIGGVMTVANESVDTIATGTKISIAMFITQLLFWGFTFAENIYMTSRLGRHPSEASRERIPKWKYWNQLFGLSISIIAFGRNVMRLTMDGGVQFLIVAEWPSYAFDGYQMVVVMGAWAIWYLPGRSKEVISKESYIELDRRV